ncbi:carboxylesterase family protein [Archangium violaceum]|uniref:carboxylesterase family protein n=1 Tax=Archangium violaceum TaxID=83451 RepID=UPI00193B5BC8|nr:carboxylesterase family protein [Archangium violaceum]QRK12854.1 carboxylesterase family protein [Archangium violaceum]
MNRYATLAMVAIGLAACGNPAIKEIRDGKIEGTIVDGVSSYKGIPFAAPPVGDLRWRAPEPVVPWSGVRSARDFAPACMQGWLGVLLSGGRSGVSEDCLYLNVWTPTDEPDARLPVLVYIHGGAFTGGTPGIPAFDGERLAREGNIVVVTIPHRLGALGFLASPELSRETGHGSGTWGLQDLVANAPLRPRRGKRLRLVHSRQPPPRRFPAARQGMRSR